MQSKLKRLITTALFAAVVCVATLVIRIPTPSTSGYIHPGDAFVILSGIVLGPFYGLVAAGLGSAMADMIGGYFLYVPATFIIKGLIGLFCGILYSKLNHNKKSRTLAVVLGGIFDIILVAGGYLIFEYLIYGPGAIASVPPNVIQGIGGLVISSLLYPALFAIGDVRDLAQEFRKKA